MNQKITIQELADSIAVKHKMNKKEAELFVRGIFELIEEALATEKYVKVKGLGTFKLVDVDNRESIDVNTGVRIEIQGHRKVTFLPEAGLKEFINKPFSHFESVPLNDESLVENEKGAEIQKSWNVASRDESEEAIVEQPAVDESEVIDDSREELMVETVIEPVETIAESAMKQASVKTIAEEFSLERELPSTLVEEPAPVERVEVEEVIENETTEAVEPADVVAHAVVSQETVTLEEAVSPPKGVVATERVDPETDRVESSSCADSVIIQSIPVAKKKKNYWLAVVVLLLLIVAGAIYFTTSHKREPLVIPAAVIASKVLEEADADTSAVVVLPSVEGAATDSLHTDLSSPVEAVVPEKSLSPVQTYSLDVKYEIVGTQMEYTIQRDETLSIVALKFYGSKKFWTYLVNHNKEVIKNPDNVPFGTTIRIPVLHAIEG